jgi:hypothetical protein
MAAPEMTPLALKLISTYLGGGEERSGGRGEEGRRAWDASQAREESIDGGRKKEEPEAESYQLPPIPSSYLDLHLHLSPSPPLLSFPPPSPQTSAHFPKRDEFSFLTVLAFPKASSRGLDSRTCGEHAGSAHSKSLSLFLFLSYTLSLSHTHTHAFSRNSPISFFPLPSPHTTHTKHPRSSHLLLHAPVLLALGPRCLALLNGRLLANVAAHVGQVLHDQLAGLGLAGARLSAHLTATQKYLGEREKGKSAVRKSLLR